MSAITNPRPSTVEPIGPLPSTPSALPPRKKSPWKLLLAVLAAGACLWGAYQLLWKPRQAAKTPVVVAVPTARVAVGPLEHVARLGGITSSTDFANVVVPRMRGPENRDQLTLLFLIQSGSKVKKGDLLAQIDGQAAQDHIDDVQSTVDAADSDIMKRKAEQSIDWENLQQTLKVAQAEYEKAKLDYSAAEVRTEIERELLRLAMEEAEARYKQSQGDIAHKQAAHKAEVRILEITRDRHKSHRDRHKMDLDRFTIHAPIDGLAVIQPTFRGGEMNLVQQGDQIRSGQLLLKVMDTSRMQVEANVNQAESSKFRIGQQAKIGLDAFPGLQLRGEVYSIGALAKGGWRENYYIRNVPIRIRIHGQDPRLIPDLSAHVDVTLDRKDNVTRIPLAAVYEENGKPLVFVKQAAGYAKRQVELGARNETHAEVLSGLEAGAEVALSRPAI